MDPGHSVYKLFVSLPKHQTGVDPSDPTREQLTLMQCLET